MTSQVIRRPNVLVLCSINLIVTMGYGLIMPVMPFYAESLGANATQLGFLYASYSITQFLFSPFWGRMSDRTGRRPIILWGLLGFSITFVILGFARSLAFLFSARLLGGALSSASGPASMASMADVTDDHERGEGMSLLGATTGLGIVLGPVLGGYLSELSIQTPFFFAAGITFIILIVSYAWLPESLNQTASDPTFTHESQQSTSPSTTTLRSLPEPVGFLLVLTFVINLASVILESIFALFLQAKLDFLGKEVGLAWSVAGISMVVTHGCGSNILMDNFSRLELRAFKPRSKTNIPTTGQTEIKMIEKTRIVLRVRHRSYINRRIWLNGSLYFSCLNQMQNGNRVNTPRIQ